MTTPTIHHVLQGSDEWHALRTGLLTASEVCRIMTPTWKPADSEKSRAHMYELLAQRITGFTEPGYLSDDMVRGHTDEALARNLYAEFYVPGRYVEQVGFITREMGHGWTMGYSPDGLVGDDGQIEIKSRKPRFQVETVLGVGAANVSNWCPSEYMLQVQSGLLVSGRKWCDFISYSGGLHMVVSRVYADKELHEKILQAGDAFELRLERERRRYLAIVEARGWYPTERSVESGEEITV